MVTLRLTDARQPVTDALQPAVGASPPPPPPPPPRPTRLRIVDAANGTFTVLVDNVEWLGAGLSPSVHHRGRRFSVEDGTLRLESDGWQTNSDKIGRYNRRYWRWSDTGSGDVRLETSVRVYATGVLVCEQRFLTPLVRMGSRRGELASTFPSFTLPPGSSAGPPRGFLQYDGDMAGQLYRVGRWQQGVRGVGSGVAGTAPLVVFAEDLRSSVVLSPFASFMSAAQQYDGQHLSYGLLNTIDSVPEGHATATVLVLGSGVRAALMGWGDVVLRWYGKSREGAWRRDPTLRTLGYCTQNGAYYYYNPIPGKSFEATMLAVAADAKARGVPYRYWLADSWWYHKGGKGAPLPGVINWTATAEAFPHGLGAIRRATGWDVQAHSRFWSSKAVYARENGGGFDFLLDRGGMALPISMAFWEYLFGEASRWGLVTYEQAR